MQKCPSEKRNRMFVPRAVGRWSGTWLPMRRLEADAVSPTNSACNTVFASRKPLFLSFPLFFFSQISCVALKFQTLNQIHFPHNTKPLQHTLLFITLTNQTL